ncbi:hypothetical protein [Raoultella terrigena]|uniref:hypothetical protein n=1 Tax=Raoultella terrigena TaxID=577 RepID=UPI001F451AEF|nr:hypothetical protein [Raoultella terrigena]
MENEKLYFQKKTGSSSGSLVKVTILVCHNDVSTLRWKKGKDTVVDEIKLSAPVKKIMRKRVGAVPEERTAAMPLRLRN